MYAQCPNCQTVFNISDAQLQAAAGKVRCGSCQETFNAFENLLDHLPGQQPAAAAPATRPLPEEPGAAFDPNLDLASALDTQELMGGLDVGGGGAAAGASPMDQTMIQDTGRTMAGGTRRLGTGRFSFNRPGLGALWGVGVGLMVLLLPLQFLLVNAPQLAQTKPGLRPLLSGLCSVAGCTLPPRRELSALTLGERQVRSHPDAPGALMLEGVISNRAGFAQPYPTVEVTLSALSGQPVALRRFAPQEYLADANADIAAGLPARGTAALKLEVADPGDEAVSFTFDFL